MKTKLTYTQYQATTQSSQSSQILLLPVLSETELQEVIGARGLQDPKGSGPD
ncbi:MAG: hypothetical protein F6K42_01115 [Leptolyngbya sp. SIO1D8]|nr:hypothetical protein [Leptolyngbya sp. SIO1D8]